MGHGEMLEIYNKGGDYAACQAKRGYDGVYRVRAVIKDSAYGNNEEQGDFERCGMSKASFTVGQTTWQVVCALVDQPCS